MRYSGSMAGPSSAYGSWRSPLTAELIARGAVGLAEPEPGETGVHWLEQRPAEGGRNVIVRRAATGETGDAIPEGFNARTRIHEYGGGAYFVHRSTIFFSNFSDQRLYRADPGEAPRPITPEPASPAALRYADGRCTPGGEMVICVRESHDEQGVVNEVVALTADGSAPPRVLVSGSDFYAFPRLDPEGRRLAWTRWDL